MPEIKKTKRRKKKTVAKKAKSSANFRWPTYAELDDEGFESSYHRMAALEKLIVAKGDFTSDEATRATYIYDQDLAERLAEWLRVELARLRVLEKSGGAGVRLGKAISRLEIADIAMTIVENADLGDNLTYLLLELMNLDRHRVKLAKNNSVARVDAATAEARQAFIKGRPWGVRELSRDVSVTPSTILKWRQSAEYQALVESKKGMWAHKLPRVGKHPKKPRK
jgi:hypothetical protein